MDSCMYKFRRTLLEVATEWIMGNMPLDTTVNLSEYEISHADNIIFVPFNVGHTYEETLESYNKGNISRVIIFSSGVNKETGIYSRAIDTTIQGVRNIDRFMSMVFNSYVKEGIHRELNYVDKILIEVADELVRENISNANMTFNGGYLKELKKIIGVSINNKSVNHTYEDIIDLHENNLNGCRIWIRHHSITTENTSVEYETMFGSQIKEFLESVIHKCKYVIRTKLIGEILNE